FTVTFSGVISSPFRITYTTDFEGISQTNYTNTALTNINESYTANVAHVQGDKFISKDGNLVGQTHIDWSLLINESQSTIDSITITDTLSQGLELVENSFELGIKDATPTLAAFNEYFELKVRPRTLLTEPQIFELVSKKTINDTMTLNYRTDIIKEDILEKKVNNSVSFEGEHVTTGTRSSSVEIATAFVTGSGTGVGEVGSFTLTKVDADDTNVKLEGAQFDLFRGERKLNLGDHLVTDSNGQVTVENLRFGEYKIIEVGAPAGYQLPVEIVDRTTTFNITSTTRETVIVTNEQARFLNIKKVANTNPNWVLSGAVFEVTNSSGTTMPAITTGIDGIARIQLPIGNYTVAEIQEPAGFFLNTEIFTVTISALQTEFELVVENRRIPGRAPDPEPEPEPTP
ncbi:MAG: hypothetical protein LRZ93_03580, partial [Clostridiales bacterium]|nr:hypothetical protein [Clostridiales bacterium]